MKVLKKQGLTFVLVMALVLTLTLGIIFMLPAKTAQADDFTPDITVDSAKALKEAVLEAPTDANTPYKIRLSADIVIGAADDEDTDGLCTGAKNFIIDLNGHTMKHIYGWWVIAVNSPDGKLELIDTSANKTGLITNDVPQGILVYNYGTLITNVNMTNKTYVGSGYITSYALIRSTPIPSMADVDNDSYKSKWAKRPSVTIKGGTLTGGATSSFFELVDSDLTIEDGTFLRDNETQKSYSIFQTETFVWESKEVNKSGLYFTEENRPALLAEIEEKLGVYLTAYAPYRGSDVLIKGGNFIGPKDRPESFTLGNEVKCNIPTASGSISDFTINETFEDQVLIEGGMWGIDFSIYCPNGMWMRKFDPLQDVGPDGDYYVVDKIASEDIVASVSSGESTISFTNFEAAWTYAVTLSGSRTVIVNQDATVSQMNLGSDAKAGTITLDLNGNKLTHTENEAAVYLNGSQEITMILKDSSELQTGELIFSLQSESSPGSARGIDIQNLNAKFVLESGTIRQTGYLPKDDKWEDPTAYGNGTQAEGASIFHIGSSASPDKLKEINAVEGAIVTIKGGNILSEIYFGTEAEHGDLTATKILVAWIDGHPNYSNSNFRQSNSPNCAADKASKFVFDLGEWIASGHTSVFSWNFKDESSDDWKNLTSLDGLNCIASSNGTYTFANADEDDNYYVNGRGYSDIAEAIAAARAADGVITLLRNTTLMEPVELENITLDFDVNVQYTLTLGENASLTLKNGAVLLYGVLEGSVTVDGNATMQAVTVQGDITVQSGTLSISSGTYNSKITVSGGSMEITGGSFRGDQVNALEQYFPKFYGAYKLATEKDYGADTLYPVQMAPDSAAREWYYKNNTAVSDSGVTYTISTPAEWNYFALFVISGADNFNGDTVKLGDDLDFGYVPANAVRSRANAAVEKTEFLCAGTYRKCRFDGIFDGCGHTMQNISVQERMVGIFGATGSNARVKNLTVKDSVFTVGSGRLDMYNYDPITKSGFCSGGAIVGEGPLDAHNDDWSGNIVLDNVKVDGGSNEGLSGNVYVGGIVGHTEGSVMIDGLKIQNRTTIVVSHKGGGVVGYLVGTFYLKNGEIEQGKNPDGSDNGLILDSENAGFPAAALVGHANGKENIIEDCTILESSDSLIGTTYANGHDSSIKIKGNNTELDIYQVVGPCEANKDRLYYGGSGREEGSKTVVEFSAEMDEKGNLKRTTVKLAAEDDDLVFADSDGEELPPEQQPQKDPQTGSYKFEERAPLVGEEFEVTIGNLKGSMAYAGQDNTELTMTVTSFELYNHGVLINSDSYGELILSVTLQPSKYTVGTSMALITSYTITGADAKNFNFQLSGNQAFIEVEIVATTLQVSVNSNGEVEYDGFVGGENESVLGGELTLNKVDNGDGTYTVTPSGLESENYNIVYVSSVVPAAAFETENNSLWIALAVIGSAVLLLGAVAVVYMVRKRKE